MLVKTNAKGRVIELAKPLPGREDFPSRLEEQFLSADGYLAKKRELDMCGQEVLYGLWRIHGEYYDLTDFIKVHPGGTSFIERTRGTDITVAFESHHIKHTRGQLLGMIRGFKVQVKEGDEQMAKAVERCKNEFQLPFTFKDGDFYDVVKTRTREYMKRKGYPSGEPTTKMKLAMTAVMAQWALAAGAAAITGKKRFAALAGVLMAGVWGVGHEAFHQGKHLKWFRYAVDLCGFSHFEQMITHAQSHHLYPNTLLDWEVFVFLPAKIAWLTAEKMQSASVFQKQVVLPLFVSLISLPETFKRLVKLAKGGVTKRKPGDLVPVALLSTFIALGGPVKGLKQWVLMNMAFSAWFVSVGLSVHHGFDENEEPLAWHEGEAGGHTDFGVHQCIATTEHSTDLGIWPSLSMFGYLNHHICHHLFPTISHCHHRELLRDVVIPTMKEFGIKHNSHSFQKLFQGFFRHISQRRFQVVNAGDKSIPAKL